MTRRQKANDSAATKQAQDRTTRQRLALLANGYLPIPVVGKQSFLKDWEAITPTEDVIRGWEHTQAEPGTGVLTRTTPAINIDIMDEATAQAIEDFTRNYFKGGRLLRRIWQAPKRAWLFRTEAPFAKLQAWFTAPDGGEPQRISILCDGQMLTVEANHPVTGQPCAWSDGDPWTVPAANLPVLTRESARAWFAGVTDLLVARGWRRTPTQVRLALLANGYEPIPLKGKAPHLNGWQAIPITEQAIRDWEGARTDEVNSGVRTRNTPAIDIDVKEAAAAEALEDLVRKSFPVG